jgi:hypothetical protein
MASAVSSCDARYQRDNQSSKSCQPRLKKTARIVLDETAARAGAVSSTISMICSWFSIGGAERLTGE